MDGDRKLGDPRYDDSRQVLKFLEKHGPATIPQAIEYFRCDRARTVLMVLKIHDRVKTDSEIVTDETLFSVKTVPIDVVYPLGTGSVWQDNELRYSLRSLEKNFPDLGRVYVVGHKPDWLGNVEHIPFGDSQSPNPIRSRPNRSCG
jgi:hypothetical protein